MSSVVLLVLSLYCLWIERNKQYAYKDPPHHHQQLKFQRVTLAALWFDWMESSSYIVSHTPKIMPANISLQLRPNMYFTALRAHPSINKSQTHQHGPQDKLDFVCQRQHPKGAGRSRPMCGWRPTATPSPSEGCLPCYNGKKTHPSRVPCPPRTLTPACQNGLIETAKWKRLLCPIYASINICSGKLS